MNWCFNFTMKWCFNLLLQFHLEKKHVSCPRFNTLSLNWSNYLSHFPAEFRQYGKLAWINEIQCSCLINYCWLQCLANYWANWFSMVKSWSLKSNDTTWYVSNFRWTLSSLDGCARVVERDKIPSIFLASILFGWVPTDYEPCFKNKHIVTWIFYVLVIYFC